MPEEPVGIIAQILSRFGIKYEKKTVLHTLRIETDQLEKCKPKIFRKRIKLISEKTGLIHYKDDNDYVILDL